MRDLFYDEIFTLMWEGYEYSADKETFFDVITCGDVTDMAEYRCMVDMLLQTQQEVDNAYIAQCPDILRKYTDKNGSEYLLGKDNFQKVFQKGHIIHTLSPLNEIVKIPHDANQIWFISPVIKVDKTIKND